MPRVLTFQKWNKRHDIPPQKRFLRTQRKIIRSGWSKRFFKSHRELILNPKYKVCKSCRTPEFEIRLFRKFRPFVIKIRNCAQHLEFLKSFRMIYHTSYYQYIYLRKFDSRWFREFWYFRPELPEYLTKNSQILESLRQYSNKWFVIKIKKFFRKLNFKNRKNPNKKSDTNYDPT